MVLSHDDILKHTALPSETVAVPEWGGDVLVRGMSGRERDEYEASVMLRGPGGELVPDTNNFRAKLITRCVVDGDGKRVFDIHTDVEALGELSAAAIERVWAVAARLSGLAATDVEQMAKDFEASPFSASSSSSLSTSASPSRGSSPKPPAGS